MTPYCHTLSKYIVMFISLILLQARAETNTRFVRIFAWLHMYLNTKRLFGCTVNDFLHIL